MVRKYKEMPVDGAGDRNVWLRKGVRGRESR
jgi:hypothetical protein